MNAVAAKATMSQDQAPKFSKDTWISLSLVVVMVGAAITFGVMYGTVQKLSTDVGEINSSLQKTREEVSALKAQRDEIVNTLSDIKSDLSEINAILLKR